MAHPSLPLLGACLVLAGTPGHAGVPMKPETAAAAMIAPWKGPFGGVPAWSAVKPEAFPEAFEAAMNAQRAAIKRITDNPKPATFENTILAMEKSSAELDRLNILFGVHTATLNVGVIPKIEEQMAPKLAAFGDEIIQNGALFKRIAEVYNSPAKAKLTKEQQRLTWLYYVNFVRSGAQLSPEQKAKLGTLNQRLATLAAQFGQNQLADETDQFTVIEKAEDLAGLSEDLKGAAARAAEKRGLKGKWVINNTRSAADPFLSYAQNRELREKVWRAFISRGDNGGKTDNKAIVVEMLKLRFERAQLLGYKTHAHWAVEQSMAGTPEKAVALMEAVWKPGAAAVKADVAAMQALADEEKAGVKIAPWDYRYYAEKVRKAKYDLDLNEVMPYMQLDKLREGMFWAAGQNYGITFTKLSGIEVQHPDVTVYEVKDAKGQHVGLWYFDPFAREGKRSGAWMNEYRTQQQMGAKPVSPIVSNNSNFVKGAPGAPVLISWDDARTLFHEFGHALHGLLSHSHYPSVSGTNTARDFVEFPSQINEHWFDTPEVLNRFAVHYQTGKPLPQELVAKIKKAGTFNEGFHTMEYLASAVIDMKLHMAGGATIDPTAFEKDELTKLGMPEEIVMRHRIPHFGHIFSGGVGGYEAGYYAYLWSDSLTADAWEAFTEGKGPWDKEVAARFKKEILSVGNTRDQGESFRAFRGRDVNTDALMRKRGFLKK
ncbi:MAG TPA: M3 family metallopeptidase [Holophagaceae bacterium]|nr:M3 family metallopeptidase [Holophagaceae bacterium]